MKKLNWKIDWFNALLGLYLFLFIFTMINREFLLFGLDLRFIELPLGALILVVNFLSKRHKRQPRKNDVVGRAFIVFYIFAFISNIAWIWSGLQLSEKMFTNELILLSNIFLAIVVFYYNKGRLNGRVISYFAIISCIILMISMILTHQGWALGDISGSKDVAYKYGSSALVDNTNAYGEDTRIAGYASDPNYATVALLIGIMCAIKSVKKIWLKSAFVAFFALAIGLSYSRTIIIVTIPCALYVWGINALRLKADSRARLNNVILIVVIAISFLVPYLRDFISTMPATLTQRFMMWRGAGDLFMQSPIIGNGLTSFRSFFAVKYWYVQAHSTYWQVLSEFGIIGFFLYYRAVSKSLNMSVEKPLSLFLMMVYIIWIATCESIALPFSIFVFYLFPIGLDDDKEMASKRRALFFVNSLRKGGAEKVCANMINELVSQGFKVDAVLIDGIGKDDIDGRKVNILDLKIRGGLIKRTLSVIMSVPKVNALLYENGECYELVSSHLPVSNLLTRLSVFSKDAIYVFHLKISRYVIGGRRLFSALLALFFWKRKVVTVSEGLRKEYINDYHGQSKLIRTIYNPVIIDEGQADIVPRELPSGKYFVCVGRLCAQKRQDRVLEIFRDGKFYEKYILVFCGTGELEEELKSRAKEMGIESRVLFVGYQSNIYSWIKNAELLISASDMEAFPMNLVESFSLGTKVVAGDCDYGPREIMVGSYKHYLVKPKSDIVQYVEKINAALHNYPDEKNRVLALCQPKRVVMQYLEFYNI